MSGSPSTLEGVFAATESRADAVMTSQPAQRVSIAIATEADRMEWDAYVASRPEAVGYHEWAWRQVFQRAFGHESIGLIARRAKGREEAGGTAPILLEIRLDLRRGQFGRWLSFAELEKPIFIAEFKEPGDQVSGLHFLRRWFRRHNGGLHSGRRQSQ